jgi:hypothetical protein
LAAAAKLGVGRHAENNKRQLRWALAKSVQRIGNALRMAKLAASATGGENGRQAHNGKPMAAKKKTRGEKRRQIWRRKSGGRQWRQHAQAQRKQAL